MQIGTEQALLWIVLLPLAGAVLNGLFGRFASRKLVSAVGVGSVGLAFAIAVISFLKLAMHESDEALAQTVYEWFSVTIGGVEVPVLVRFVMDPLSGVMTLVVTGVGLLIHIYSLGYMHDDPGYARFFAYLNLFMASMLLLVLASSLPLMFVGWEGVGLCSYLLIGFWWENTEYAKAGRKAFVMNRIGDFGVLMAMFILVTAAGSFEFAEINDQATVLGASPLQFGAITLGSVATAACLFLFLGAAGKSAQIPLYTWLPDAMAGPTPVSALIHAATMVTAGVYLCCRLSGLFIEAPTAMAVVAVVGAFTALLAASIALVQNDMKKILAYSTVSQLGFMFGAVGCGAFQAGIFHVYTHAFFKACLFLGAGSVMHAVGSHGDADIRKLGGLRSIMPTTHWTFLLSCLAIAGFPLFSGFFSKDMILMGAAASAELGYHGAPWVGWLVYGVLVLAAIMTAFYMFRLYFRTFSGSYRSAPAEGVEVDEEYEAVADAEGGGMAAARSAAAGEPAGAGLGDVEAHGHTYDPHPHESPPSMTVPLMVLGAGALVAGFVNMEPIFVHIDVWGEWLAPAVAALEGEAHLAHTLASAGGFGAMAIGLFLAFTMYNNRATDALPERMPAALHRLLFEKWRVDELYDATIVRGVQQLAVLAGWVDKTFVDGLLTKATSGVVRVGGLLLTRVQTGLVYAYGAVLVVGVSVMGFWFLYPQIDLQSQVQHEDVTWTAAPGLGYEYRWDANADGRWETGWGEHRSVSFTYEPRDWRRHVLKVQAAGPADDVREIVLEPGDSPATIPGRWLGPRWRRPEGQGSGEPTVAVEEDRFVIHARGARLRSGGQQVDRAELAPGEGAVLGGITQGVAVQAAVQVEAKLQVRNAFGNKRSETAATTLVPKAGSQRVAARDGAAADAKGGVR